MAFYEEWGKKLSQTGQQAMQKTRNFAESTKLNMEINTLEREIREAYCQIGFIYYKKYRNDLADDEMAEFIRLISEKEALIEEYQAQIRASKGLVVCKNCGAEINATAMFCYNCGTRTEYEESVEKKISYCQFCGAPLEKEYAFCGSCGMKIPAEVEVFKENISGPVDQESIIPESAETASESTETANDSIGEEMSGVGNDSQQKQRFCTECGTAVEADDIFCAFCGHQLDTM